jgi:predicted nuclease with TOPRIM domain
LEQLRLEAEHEIRSAVGELQGENEELRQQILQQQQQQGHLDEERQEHLTEISRLKSEVLALKTRLQSSEGDEMRQHVMTYEQVHFRPIVHPRPYAV